MANSPSGDSMTDRLVRVLEQGTVEVLDQLGEFSRARTVGHRHDGVELRFDGAGHRIDFADLVGRSVWLYPQHEALKDLIASRLAGGQDLRFGITAERVEDAATDRPRVVATDAEGSPLVIEADFVVGADGSRSVAREAVTGASTGGYFREYPFAWFDILCEAPTSAPELIYSNSQNGFALISQRSETVQRMYFQCDPDEDPNRFAEEELWAELQSSRARHDAPGRSDLPARHPAIPQLRRVRGAARARRARRRCGAHRPAHRGEGHEPRRRRRARAGAGAARPAARRGCGSARGVPRDGSAPHLEGAALLVVDDELLHVALGASEFDRLRQLGELRSVVESETGSTYLAEAYTGWPLELG